MTQTLRRHAVPMVGRRFGRWTVLGMADNSRPGYRSWLCRCDCGRAGPVLGRDLRCGRATACRSCKAAMRKPAGDLTGQTFGRWTVLGLSAVLANRSRLWRCRCRCGGVHEVEGRILRSGASQGCRACKAKRQERVAYSRLWNYMGACAKARGIEFRLTREYVFGLLEAQAGRCALSGVEIGFAVGRQRHMHGGTTASLDRIDSGRGYVVGNVQWVHKDVNRMKSNLHQDRFIELCRCVAVKRCGLRL